MRMLAPLAVLLSVATLSAQGRVVLGGVPSNLQFNLGTTVVAPDASASNAFFALIPITNGQNSLGFAVFDGDIQMNSLFGTGNWLRCRMFATDWAYLSTAVCAQQPALGGSAPLSLLTTDYDYGPYTGRPGIPRTPWPDATLFTGSSQSFCQGLPSFSQERWQLRTRGFATNDAWNACPPNLQVTQNFSGWLIARFTFTFV